MDPPRDALLAEEGQLLAPNQRHLTTLVAPCVYLHKRRKALNMALYAEVVVVNDLFTATTGYFHSLLFLLCLSVSF